MQFKSSTNRGFEKSWGSPVLTGWLDTDLGDPKNPWVSCVLSGFLANIEYKWLILVMIYIYIYMYIISLTYIYNILYIYAFLVDQGWGYNYTIYLSILSEDYEIPMRSPWLCRDPSLTNSTLLPPLLARLEISITSRENPAGKWKPGSVKFTRPFSKSPEWDLTIKNMDWTIKNMDWTIKNYDLTIPN